MKYVYEVFVTKNVSCENMVGQVCKIFRQHVLVLVEIHKRLNLIFLSLKLQLSCWETTFLMQECVVGFVIQKALGFRIRDRKQ